MAGSPGAAAFANECRSGGLVVQHLGRIDYATALALQESIRERKIAGDPADHLLQLEHEPVYTLGRGADAADLRGAPERLGVPWYRVGRGGGATFHGPGQLVTYPIVRLAVGGRDVHRYVRGLEEVLVAACARLGISAAPRPGLTGIWVDGEKIASIGIGVRRGVTLHGTALNVSTDLSYFDAIVACRGDGQRTTSIGRLLGCSPSVAETGRILSECFRERFRYPEVVER